MYMSATVYTYTLISYQPCHNKLLITCKDFSLQFISTQLDSERDEIVKWLYSCGNTKAVYSYNHQSGSCISHNADTDPQVMPNIKSVDTIRYNTIEARHIPWHYYLNYCPVLNQIRILTFNSLIESRSYIITPWLNRAKNWWWRLCYYNSK